MKIQLEIPEDLLRAVVKRQHELEIPNRTEAIRTALRVWCYNPTMKPIALPADTVKQQP